MTSEPMIQLKITSINAKSALNLHTQPLHAKKISFAPGAVKKAVTEAVPHKNKKCANCQGNHSSLYKGCKAYKSEFENAQKEKLGKIKENKIKTITKNTNNLQKNVNNLELTYANALKNNETNNNKNNEMMQSLTTRLDEIQLTSNKHLEDMKNINEKLEKIIKLSNETNEKIIDLERKLNEKIYKVEKTTTRRLTDIDIKLKNKIETEDLGAVLFEIIHCIMSGKMSNKMEMATNVMEIFERNIRNINKQTVVTKIANLVEKKYNSPEKNEKQTITNTKKKMMDQIKIIQININGIQNKNEELKVLIIENEPDIVTINETKLYNDKNFLIKRYTTIKKKRIGVTHRKRGGGLITLIKKNLKHDNIKFIEIEKHEFISVDIYFENQIVHLINGYIPPQAKLNPEIIELICKPNTLLVGDLNAKHKSWGSSKTDHRGKTIEYSLENARNRK